MSYSIRVTALDGEVVVDELVDGYVLLIKKPSDDPTVREADKEITGVMTEGLNAMEILGTLTWALRLQTDYARDDSYSLAGEEDDQ